VSESNSSYPNRSGGADGNVSDSGPGLTITGIDFSIELDGWPWENSSDHLGIVMQDQVPSGTHLSVATTGPFQYLNQSSNSTGEWISFLGVDGPVSAAGVPANGSSGNASSQFGLYDVEAPADAAVVLVGLSEVRGGSNIVRYEGGFGFSVGGTP
jgi:hypothetical protein